MVLIQRLKFFFAALLVVGAVGLSQPIANAAYNPLGKACQDAAPGADSAACEAQQTTTDPVSDTIRSVAAIVATLAGIISVVIIIYNGFRLITARGDTNQVKAAQSGILHAVVGILVIVLASSITFLFINFVS